jgi:hypothetical protein
MSAIEAGGHGGLNDVASIEVIIDPLRNRTGGDELHSRRLLKAKGKSRMKARRSPEESTTATVVDLRKEEASPLATFDFEAEVAAARAEAEGAHG